MRGTLSRFLAAQSAYTGAQPKAPAEQSFAYLEEGLSRRPESTRTAFCTALLLHDLAVEHGRLFLRGLDERLPLAVCSSVRVVLENTALALWLLDLSIGAPQRIYRVFRYRYRGLDQQRRIRVDRGKDTRAIEAKIRRLGEEASDLGVPVGEKGGLPTLARLPAYTDLIARRDKSFGVLYRVLSAIQHGHDWAIREWCYEIGERTAGTDGNASSETTKIVHPQYMALASSSIVVDLWSLVLQMAAFMGWDIDLYFRLVQGDATAVVASAVSVWQKEDPDFDADSLGIPVSLRS